MAASVYLLCALTAVGCGGLLLRGYRRSGRSLLLWSGLCFAGLAVNNALVFADLVVFPDVSLFGWRNGVALAAMCLLLYGLIWASDR